MGTVKKNLIANILGVTKSGKYIHIDPKKNVNFKKQDHLDAYNAHAKFLMHNLVQKSINEQHRLAMNEHYLLAIRVEERS